MKKSVSLLSVALVTLVTLVSCGGSKTGPAEKVLQKKVYAQVVNKYESVGYFVDGISIVSAGWKQHGAINAKGEEIIPADKSMMGKVIEGMIIARDKEDKYGAYNTKGELVVPFKYDDMAEYASGMARVRVGGYIDGKYGYVDKTGNEVIPAEYGVAAKKFSEGLAFVGTKDGWSYKYGYINAKGEEVIPLMYTDANDFHEGMAAVRTKNGYGYINTKGELLTAAKYDDAMPFSEGFALVEKNEKIMVINKKGEELYTFAKNITPASAYHDGLLLVYDAKIKKFGYYNEKGEIALPFEYPAADSFNEGKALTLHVEGDEYTFTYIDKKGKSVGTIDEDTYIWEYNDIEDLFQTIVEKVISEVKLQALKNNLPEELAEIIPALKVDKLIDTYIQAALADNDDLVDNLEEQFERIIEMAEGIYDEDVAESLEEYLDAFIDAL